MVDKPHLTQAGETERQAREQRSAAALRENLRRRKEQARARAAAPDQGQKTAQSMPPADPSDLSPERSPDPSPDRSVEPDEALR